MRVSIFSYFLKFLKANESICKLQITRLLNRSKYFLSLYLEKAPGGSPAFHCSKEFKLQMRFLTVNLVANKKKKTIERYYIFYTLMSWFKKKKKGERGRKSPLTIWILSVFVCVFMCSVGSWCFTARHPDLRTAKKEALVVWADRMSWPSLFHCGKIARPNQPGPCTGKVIKLAPMRVSSLIMPAPDILLTPLSHYESWKCTAPHLTSTHW